MIFRPKRNEFFYYKKKKKEKKKRKLKSLSFSFDPKTPKQRKMGWKMNQIHNQWNSNTFLWGPIIRGPDPFIRQGPKAQAEEGDGPGSAIQVRDSLGTQPRTIQSSACSRSHKKKGQKWYRNNLGKKNLKYLCQQKGVCWKLQRSGKAALTAIQYSAPNRAILSSFYNHPQPLWVWADGTSISLGMSILHVDKG